MGLITIAGVPILALSQGGRGIFKPVTKKPSEQAKLKAMGRMTTG